MIFEPPKIDNQRNPIPDDTRVFVGWDFFLERGWSIQICIFYGEKKTGWVVEPTQMKHMRQSKK